ncbi:Alkaline phosphatase synthesis transcriptional regulatory protein PhoP [Pseudobythopirellula maris]|uniref:Alkaline phosphatase synthesis transcriptional regulatory protein PhoP n=1 Tax=Pseudobythopirellula maris TaxID=2527991 RepID=A0A5C5ZTU1_9BACT|nr:response regulator [Pseudobythopirellula maris]TWT90849.1 Alkaline phosphatase synthesis transcriptional regulatory protein PhoP [Pseudobythopirellula maris]
MTKKILIAEDDPDLLRLLVRRCQSLRHEVDSADDAILALCKLEGTLPDLAILDVDMPGGNGLSVCEMMSTHEQMRAIPTIMLTGNSDPDTIRRCHSLGAYYVQKSVDVWSRLEPLLRELLGEGTAPAEEAGEVKEVSETEQAVEAALHSGEGCLYAVQTDPNAESDTIIDAVFAALGVEGGDQAFESEPDSAEPADDRPWVLSVEDDDDIALALKLRLAESGYNMVRATAGVEGYRKAFMTAPSAILLDYELPNGNGDYVLRRLKESPATSDIPVIVLTGRREATIERQMRNLGADEFLTKPFDWRRLRESLERLVDTNAVGA